MEVNTMTKKVTIENNSVRRVEFFVENSEKDVGLVFISILILSITINKLF